MEKKQNMKAFLKLHSSTKPEHLAIKEQHPEAEEPETSLKRRRRGPKTENKIIFKKKEKKRSIKKSNNTFVYNFYQSSTYANYFIMCNKITHPIKQH